ncbi:hypothetical protein [Streptomyces sp. bgisy154]|uniref:hypothetical protein n=1 Tax=Streptomyces sp. bgisy154 TaxID=3413794 RepID=UPI003D7082AD
MSARDKLYAYAGTPSVLPERMLDAALDAYRTEVLAKAVSRLRAVPVQCTALTGPVWYGAGWNDAITTLEEIADYQVPDDEAYPGELQRLRALALALRVAALRKEDLGEVRRLLVAHAEHEMDAREKCSPRGADATPDKASARDTRLAQLLDTIRTHPGKWTTGLVQDIRRTTGGPTQRGTARRDLAELHRRGHLLRHGAGDARFYTLKTRKDSRP